MDGGGGGSCLRCGMGGAELLGSIQGLEGELLELICLFV